MMQTTNRSAGIELPLFPGFLVEDIQTAGATIRTLRMGSGRPLLLLHGYPQTHVIWHKIAANLAEHFTIILTDLRGYGDSSKPDSGVRHENYSFRAMARDQLEVMRHFGQEHFFVAAHDRGARTAHRLCLDNPEAVRKVCFMDIVPTLRRYRDTSKEFATKYMWWFFLIQVAPLPEHMIGADSEFFLRDAEWDTRSAYGKGASRI
jgi:haloacetate dehalogenase